MVVADPLPFKNMAGN